MINYFKNHLLQELYLSHTGYNSLTTLNFNKKKKI